MRSRHTQCLPKMPETCKRFLKSRRQSHRAWLHFYDRQRNNSLRSTKNGWLIKAHKGCQTTGPSSAKDKTDYPSLIVEHNEQVANNLETGRVYSAASTCRLKRNNLNSNDSPGSIKKPDAISRSTSRDDNENSFCKTGLSMSDSVLWMPSGEYSKSASIFRQCKEHQEINVYRRASNLLRCQKFTSNHRIKNLGNEVDQIWSRKRTARIALESFPRSERKKPLQENKSPVELLWKPQIPNTIQSGDENMSIIKSFSKPSEIPEVGEVIRCPGTTKLVSISSNLIDSLIPASNTDKTHQLNSHDRLNDESKIQKRKDYCRKLSRTKSQESVQYIGIVSESPRTNVTNKMRLRNHSDRSTEQDTNQVTIISVKKERGNIVVVADREELHSCIGGTRPVRKTRNLTHLDDHDDDYHFLMSLHHQLKKMPEARKLKMRLKMQAMLCEEIDSDSGSSRSREHL